jgi:hypothetical protein
MKAESAKVLKEKASAAMKEETPLVVSWQPSPATSSYMFFSVHHGEVATYAKQCRVVVALNKTTMHFSCPCPPHKAAKRGVYGLRCVHAKVRPPKI